MLDFRAYTFSILKLIKRNTIMSEKQKYHAGNKTYILKISVDLYINKEDIV